MAAISEYQLTNLSFGYLSGADLIQFCPVQLLTSRYQVDPLLLSNGCQDAYAEITAMFNTKYNIVLELSLISFTNAQGTTTVDGNQVTAIVLTSGGTNYGTAPAVSFNGVGTGATATAIITNGIVTGFTGLPSGTCYTTAPAVTFTGGAATDTRSRLLVKICTIYALRNILGNLQGAGNMLEAHYNWATETALAIRNGQMNLPLQLPAAPNSSYPYCTPASGSGLVGSSWRTLG